MAAEIVRTVQVMDTRNWQRFQDNEPLRGSWISASKVWAIGLVFRPRDLTDRSDLVRLGGYGSAWSFIATLD